jgi:hypothetical protein
MNCCTWRCATTWSESGTTDRSGLFIEIRSQSFDGCGRVAGTVHGAFAVSLGSNPGAREAQCDAIRETIKAAYFETLTALTSPRAVP